MSLNVPFGYLQLLQYVLGDLNISLLGVNVFECLVHAPFILHDAIHNSHCYGGALVLLRHDETGRVVVDSFFDEIKEVHDEVDVVQLVHLVL
tara:strand:+ start:354 stop:629 length:276 start_codon:yes stop_codon:yes gene_type:complete